MCARDHAPFDAPLGIALPRCTEPPTHSSCPAEGKWTSRAPGTGTTDCYDSNAAVRPYLASENIDAWSIDPIAGVATSVDFDYNCDGTEEPRWPTVSVSTSATCTTCGPVGCFCSGVSGWTSSSVAACGSFANLTFCNFTSTCSRQVESTQQQCR